MENSSNTVKLAVDTENIDDNNAGDNVPATIYETLTIWKSFHPTQFLQVIYRIQVVVA